MGDKVSPVDATPIRLAPLTGIEPDYKLGGEYATLVGVSKPLSAAKKDDQISRISRGMRNFDSESESVDISLSTQRKTDIEDETSEDKYAMVSLAPDDTDDDCRPLSPKSEQGMKRSDDDVDDGSEELNEVPVGKKRLKVKPSSSKSSLANNEIMMMVQKQVGEILQELTYQNIQYTAREFKKSVMVLFVDKKSWDVGLFYFAVGLLMAFICEMMNGPKYNVVVLLGVMASVYFKHFPGNSVRPQLVVTLLTTTSFAADIYYLTLPLHVVTNGSKALTVVVMVTKVLVLYNFLWLSSGSTKARKYLQR